MAMWNSDTLLLTARVRDARQPLLLHPVLAKHQQQPLHDGVDFAGSDIEEQNITLAQWINDFVDDKPVSSHLEDPVPGEDP